MEIEIKRSENGWHCKIKDTEEEYCLETMKTLLAYLARFMPEKIGDEIKVTN